MWMLSTLRFVPPISTEAWIKSMLVLAAYLFAEAGGLPFDIAPAAFAVALYLFLTVSMNVGLRLLRGQCRTGPERAALFATMLVTTPLAVWLLLRPETTAMAFWVGWQVAVALIVALMVFFGSDLLDRLPSVWAGDDPRAGLAISLQAGGFGLVALTGLIIARTCDPAAFVAFMTLGTKLFHFAVNWVILLALIDADGDG